MQGPQIGEKWSVGGWKNLVFLGVGRNLQEERVFVFLRGEHMFVLTKDEFYAEDMERNKQE